MFIIGNGLAASTPTGDRNMMLERKLLKRADATPAGRSQQRKTSRLVTATAANPMDAVSVRQSVSRPVAAVARSLVRSLARSPASQTTAQPNE